MEVFRRAVIPVASGFVLFVVMALRAWRIPDEEERRPPGDLRTLIAEQLMTIVGGYLLFLVIVLVFHVLNAGQSHALTSAAKGGAFLAFGVATPVFILGSLWFSRPPRQAD